MTLRSIPCLTISVLMCLLATPVAAQELFWRGAKGHIDEGTGTKPNPKYSPARACKNYDDLIRFEHLREEDYKAAMVFAARRCTYIPNGTPITVEDANFLHTVLCVRPKGSPDCLWIKAMWTAP